MYNLLNLKGDDIMYLETAVDRDTLRLKENYNKLLLIKNNSHSTKRIDFSVVKDVHVYRRIVEKDEPNQIIGYEKSAHIGSLERGNVQSPYHLCITFKKLPFAPKESNRIRCYPPNWAFKDTFHMHYPYRTTRLSPSRQQNIALSVNKEVSEELEDFIQANCKVYETNSCYLLIPLSKQATDFETIMFIIHKYVEK